MNDDLMLQCTFEDDSTFTNGWIPYDKRLKPGWSVELIDPDTKERRVFKIASMSRPIKRSFINRGWNNNI